MALPPDTGDLDVFARELMNRLGAVDLLRRRPQRVTATLPWHLVQHLQERADFEGRSLSNLIAHLLEAAKA
jgi:hypothetical protein